VANGETFARAGDSPQATDEFEALAKALFALERRGDIEIPSGRIQKDYMSSRGAYRPIAPQLTPQGRGRLERDA